MATSHKILFILKRREDFNPTEHTKHGMSTGLYNSASFMVDMLNGLGIASNLEVAIDNNCIDRLVTLHNPTHVIIEALWVTPIKFTVLAKLHPTIKWIIRVHSELPFISGEGIAMNWIGDYSTIENVIIGVNAPRMYNETKLYIKIKNNWDDLTVDQKVIYLPNYYPQNYKIKEYTLDDVVNIGCFGAVRPLKNHIIQAIASLKFANSIGKKLRFHVNGGRIEGKGDPVMNNLNSLFEHVYSSGHQLIVQDWRPRDEFLKVCESMDIGLQVSFSETFNIVGADVISQGVPLVGSSEIPWSADKYCARAQYSDEIFNALMLTHNDVQDNVNAHQLNLTKYTTETASVWFNYFKE